MSRLSYALLTALALHGALLLVRARHTAPRAPVEARAALELDEVDVTPAAQKPADIPSEPSEVPGALHVPSAAGAARQGTHALGSGPTEPGAAPNAEASDRTDVASNQASAGPAGAVGSAQASTAPPINLHLDDGFFMRPAGEALPRARKPEFERQMEAAVLADDVKRGAARGNVLLGPLNDAVRGAGPVRGEALLSVIIGADGSVSAVQFLRGAASDWSSAIESFRALAANKHVRVPAGARGLRVTFSIQSKVQLPSGKSLGSGGNVAPSGLGLSGTFDVADIGAVAQRMVHARVISEEVL